MPLDRVLHNTTTNRARVSTAVNCFTLAISTLAANVINDSFDCLFQDLQGEIDTERENFLSLTASGKKLLSSLEVGGGGGAVAAAAAANASGDDAVALKNKLEEMNERWNYLKAKSVAIR